MKRRCIVRLDDAQGIAGHGRLSFASFSFPVKENEERLEKTLWISNNRFEFLSKGESLVPY
jgi:hypothetical protein